LKASKKMTDTVRVAGKSRLSFVKSSNVVSGPSRIPDFLDSSSKSLEHSPVPRCPVAAATEVVVRQTRMPVIDVSSTPTLSAPSSGGEASCFL
jgi:hypothetical protein